MATKAAEKSATGNPRLLADAVNKILDDPDCWDQSTWHCGTTHCVGGHVQILGGRPAIGSNVISDVAELLGISEFDSSWLCAGGRTLPEIHAFASDLLAGKSLFNRDGYDRDGYDRDGYDRYGYDRYGYNRDGYDRDGYDRDGYDRYGKPLPKL